MNGDRARGARAVAGESPATVVVIDDEPVMREACAEVLEPEGYRIFVASDGTEGLDLVRTRQPDLVLVDLRMPGLSGMDLVRRLIEEAPSSVVVVITGYPSIDGAVESVRSGAFDFIPKPFTPAELRVALRRGLERRRSLAERSASSLSSPAVALQLRTPLAAAQQYLEVLRFGHLADLPSEVLEVIDRAAIRLAELAELMEDWLALARLDEERLPDRFAPVDLEALVRGQLDEIGPLLERNGTSAEMTVVGGLPSVAGHDESLCRVVRSLLWLAAGRGRPGGHVEVRLSATEGGARLEVESEGAVDDQRPGQGAVPRREEDPPTDLGLVLIDKLVAAHGGSLSSRSAGRDTAVAVDLPAKTPRS